MAAWIIASWHDELSHINKQTVHRRAYGLVRHADHPTPTYHVPPRRKIYF